MPHIGAPIGDIDPRKDKDENTGPIAPSPENLSDEEIDLLLEDLRREPVTELDIV